MLFRSINKIITLLFFRQILKFKFLYKGFILFERGLSISLMIIIFLVGCDSFRNNTDIKVAVSLRDKARVNALIAEKQILSAEPFNRKVKRKINQIRIYILIPIEQGLIL